MSQLGYLLIAIAVIVSLLTIFIVSFILYKKTPVPKGCENITINEENCSMCGNVECKHYQGGDK